RCRSARALGDEESSPEGVRVPIGALDADLLYQSGRTGVDGGATASARPGEGRAAPGVRPRRHFGAGPRKESVMPEKKVVERAMEDLREGKGPSTAAGELVRGEMHHVREGKHGTRSTKQAIDIGRSAEACSGIPVTPPPA